MKRVAFITGASSGIGYELALDLAAKGYTLAVASRRREALENLVEKVRQGGREAIPLVCDVADQGQVKRAIAEAGGRAGGIDLAILSAGISEPTDSINFTAEKFERVLRTNLLGVAYCLEELIPIMKRQGRGTIAAISSLAGDRGIPGSAGYCATKAGLSTLFDGMRVELRAHGIRLVTIEPGYVLTPMTEKFGAMPLVMQADEAARRIVRGLEREDRVIRFPFAASAFMKLMRILPVSVFDLVAAKHRPVRLDG